MTTKESIRYFEDLLKAFTDRREEEESYWGKKHVGTTIGALNAAISALREKESLEELERNNEPCVGCKRGWSSVSEKGIKSCHDDCQVLRDWRERQKEGYGNANE